MADHTAENDMNVHLSDANNNIVDPNNDLNNAGPADLNIGNNNNTGNNKGHDGDMSGPSEYRDGLTASSSSLSRRPEDDGRPLQNYQPPAF